ncbi:hypothetical protein B0O99DRAFT_619257 [Bisporella sp. PMI_857]|nr:hypothetical protein B0O99DRAFT_619257 [Bisporella sp. PMI_857]
MESVYSCWRRRWNRIFTAWRLGSPLGVLFLWVFGIRGLEYGVRYGIDDLSHLALRVSRVCGFVSL